MGFAEDCLHLTLLGLVSADNAQTIRLDEAFRFDRR